MENVIYQLSISDIQTVANDELDRDLSDEEIPKIIDYIEKHIDWYGIISNGIAQL
jgi:hypothetical protein